MLSFPTVPIHWTASCRLIPSRFPPVELYEPVCPELDWDALKRVEGMTNPRLREMEIGLGLLHPDDRGRVSQNWIVAPFTYPDPEPTAFSDGTYGVCTVAENPQGALLLAVQKREAFLRRTDTGPTRLEMRMLKTPLKAELHDLQIASGLDDWSFTQEAASNLRKADSYGLLLPDRDGVGRLAVVLRPTAFCGFAVQAEHYAFLWDGNRIKEIYDFSTGEAFDPARLTKSRSTRAA